MALDYFYDKTVDIHRITETADTDNESYEEHLTDVACCIQALDESFGEDLEGSYGKDFLMFCPDSDIKQEDKVIDGTTEYRVVGVESYSFMGEEHMEVRIRITQ
jgi:hypothetical protein